MTKKGQSRHLKRIAAPKYWPILRKASKWTFHPMPGPHPKNACLPLAIVLRDILKVANSKRELKYILNNNEIKVDGRIRKDLNFPVGLMDVIEIPKIEKYYRIIPFEKRGLLPHEIDSNEKDFKLCKIINKTMLKGNILQLNLHDGRNILIKPTESDEEEEVLKPEDFKTKDTLKISIPNQEILDHFEFQENKIGLVTSGRFIGKIGKISEIFVRFGPNASIATMEELGEPFQTLLDYIFVIGRTKPEISLPNLEE